ncbi:MAG TPA: hypothetical protein VM073_06420 [Usitatibacter sp.]|nr:hypothetical protein [Usitatibacter sp.]
MGLRDLFKAPELRKSICNKEDAAVEYSPQANLYLYNDGLRIERTVGNTILRFKSKSDGTAGTTGELLSALMR